MAGKQTLKIQFFNTLTLNLKLFPDKVMEELINRYTDRTHCEKKLNMLKNNNKYNEFDREFYGNVIHKAYRLATKFKNRDFKKSDKIELLEIDLNLYNDFISEIE